MIGTRVVHACSSVSTCHSNASLAVLFDPGDDSLHQEWSNRQQTNLEPELEKCRTEELLALSAGRTRRFWSIFVFRAVSEIRTITSQNCLLLFFALDQLIVIFTEKR